LVKVEDSDLVDFGKELTQNLVKIFTEFSGVQNNNDDDETNSGSFSPSPYKKVSIGDGERRKTSDFSILEKYDQSEKELITLKKT
jgi:hypothetical protein